MKRSGRVIIDCRDFLNEIGCSLLISGNSREVLNVAVRHAVEEHGHKDTTELRKLVKAMMKPELIKSSKKLKKERQLNK